MSSCVRSGSQWVLVIEFNVDILLIIFVSTWFCISPLLRKLDSAGWSVITWHIMFLTGQCATDWVGFLEHVSAPTPFTRVVFYFKIEFKITNAWVANVKELMLLPSIPTNGWWSVDTMRLLHPNVNILNFSRFKETTEASLSLGEYLNLISRVKRRPA